MRITAERGTRGLVVFTANVARAAARKKVVARKRFAVRANGRATVRLRLRKAGRRVLRRRKVLRARARVVLRNEAGLKSTTTKRVRIKLRRRR